ncbi:MULTISPECIES: hypothetical protein [unclassified Bradyrhizobium]|uniref:hypothetical protein n=1 Tax=unclassified Bradyrhizobium TaxID=2631580 RepID=UPI001BAC2FE5|nr:MULTISPECIES: hypothetical protein [unclassified Bradyrhizobium]MBR1201864.1 hypothetical protein [Bradyrhizobium sp. AUGA SZCCT0124]MBR1311567.1 hypothetical protein [Bradyrhizobium sp. AUGA SZCCT0051]MBR1338813.1 hypothetical protein [Bradyrhizobium sp. AUGA SZCCT0105]MBR1353387.1 hypothetical protein [Bradyrhizobium sp. AUGA SZCCT0045]
MAGSKSARISSNINVGSEFRAGSASNRINRLDGNSECFVACKMLRRKNQLSALDASAAGYDTGKEWEAERLSAAVFTLVHGRGSVSSLPSQLGVTLRFVSSGGVVTGHGLPAPAIAFPSLLIFEGGTDGRGLSPSSTMNRDLYLDRQIIPCIPFDDW